METRWWRSSMRSWTLSPPFTGCMPRTFAANPDQRCGSSDFTPTYPSELTFTRPSPPSGVRGPVLSPELYSTKTAVHRTGCLPPGSGSGGGPDGGCGGNGCGWQPSRLHLSGGNLGGFGPDGGACWVYGAGAAESSQGPSPVRTCCSTRPSWSEPAWGVWPRKGLGASRATRPAPLTPIWVALTVTVPGWAWKSARAMPAWSRASENFRCWSLNCTRWVAPGCAVPPWKLKPSPLNAYTGVAALRTPWKSSLQVA